MSHEPNAAASLVYVASVDIFLSTYLKKKGAFGQENAEYTDKRTQDFAFCLLPFSTLKLSFQLPTRRCNHVSWVTFPLIFSENFPNHSDLGVFVESDFVFWLFLPFGFGFVIKDH